MRPPSEELHEQPGQHLHERTRLLRLLVETVPACAIALLDPEGRVIEWSTGAERLTGLSAEAMVGRSIGDLYAPDERKADRLGADLSVAAERGTQERVVEFIGAGQTWVRCRVTLTALRDEEGHLLGYGWVQYRRGEAEDHEAAWTESHVLLDTVSDGVIGLDADERITFMNLAAARMLGVDRERVIGEAQRDVFELRRGDGSDYPQGERSPILNALGDGGAQTVSAAQFARSDGARFPVEYSAVPVLLDGSPSGVVVTFRDVTEAQRNLERDREAMREHAALVEAEAAARWARYLAEASKRLGTTLDVDATLANIVDLAIPALADYCFIDLLDEKQQVHRLAAAHAQQERSWLVDRLRMFAPNLRHPSGVAQVLRTGQSLFIPETTDADLRSIAHEPEHLELMRKINASSMMIVPMTARGQVVGAITFASVRDTGRRLSPSDLAHAEDLAARAALALQNARSLQAMKESEARFRLMFERSGIAMGLQDSNLVLLDVNHAFEALLGRPAEQLRGTRITDVTSPEDVQETLDRTHALLSEKRERDSFEKRYIHSSGRTVWVKVNLSRLSGAMGSASVLTFAEDITAQKMAEERLRLLESVVTNANDAIVVTEAGPLTHPGPRVEFVNEAFEKLAGCKAEDVLGQPIQSVLHAADTQEAERILANLVSGRGTRAELLIRRDDGRECWVDTSIVPVRDAKRRITHWASIQRDVTERHLAGEKAVQVARDEAGRAEAEAARERIEGVLESIRDAFLALDPALRLVYVNGPAERLLGKGRNEVLGRALEETAIAIRLGAEFEVQCRNALQGKEPLHWTENLGETDTWLSFQAFPSPEGVSVFVSDVTERRRAEDAQRRLTAVLEATPDYVMSADERGRAWYINYAARQLLGIDHDVDPSTLALTSLHPDAAARKVLDEGVPFAIRDHAWIGESAVGPPGGQDIPVSQVIVSHRREDGTIEGLSTICRDITYRKRAEEAQRYLAEASQTLVAELDFRSAPQVLAETAVPALADFCRVLLLEDGKLRQAGGAHRDPERLADVQAVEGFRFDLDRSVGAPSAVRTGRSELVSEVSDAWLWAATGNEAQFQALRRLQARSYMIVPLVARGHTLGAVVLGSTVRGQFKRADLATAEDLTTRAALAIDNARAYEQSLQATRLREEVLGIVSHDLRSPLSTVTLSANQLLRKLPQTPEHASERKQAERILSSTQRATRLIGDLLDVARMEAGRLPVSTRPLPVTRVVEEVLEIHRPLADERRLALSAAVEGEPGDVLADPDRLQQVFSNLLGNALRLTPPGGSISIQARRKDGEIEFSVKDTGPGIPEEQLPHIFNRFWQARHAKRGNAGLGLTIVRGIVEAHGGQIHAESQVGQGTTFRFTLPRATPAARPA